MSFNYFDVLLNDLDSENEKKIDVIQKYKDGEYKIVTEQARYPLANLPEIFKTHQLNPSYQRKKVWDNERKSRLIESFIINIPIPSVFLYEVEYSKYEVMDGQQRISTILDFYNDKFKLSDLELFNELNGFKYSELPDEIKRGIDRRYLSAIILLNETASNDYNAMKMKQFVFERLNTGAVRLEPQEIRNALHLGLFNDLLIELANNKTFRKLWKFEVDQTQRMEDCELILRFFSYKSACKHNISKSTKKILDMYSKIAVQFTASDVNELRKLFLSTIELVYEIFGDSAFKSKENSKRSEKMIYDTIMLYVSELVENKNYKNIRNLSQEKFSIIKKFDKEFNGKYTSINNVNTRKKIMNDEIGKILYNEE